MEIVVLKIRQWRVTIAANKKADSYQLVNTVLMIVIKVVGGAALLAIVIFAFAKLR